MRTLFSKDERRALANEAADKIDGSRVERWVFVRAYLAAHYLVDVFMTRKYGLPDDD